MHCQNIVCKYDDGGVNVEWLYVSDAGERVVSSKLLEDEQILAKQLIDLVTSRARKFNMVLSGPTMQDHRRIEITCNSINLTLMMACKHYKKPNTGSMCANKDSRWCKVVDDLEGVKVVK